MYFIIQKILFGDNLLSNLLYVFEQKQKGMNFFTMKILEKFALILFSLLTLIASVIICLIIFNIISIEQIEFCIDYVMSDVALTITVLSVSIFCILLSIRCLFYRRKKQIKKSTSDDVLLENAAGRLLISKNSIENAVNNIVKTSMSEGSDIKVTVDIDPANNISVYVSVVLDSTEKVKSATIDLQMKIKNKIKENFGIDIKQVNIKIDSEEKELDKVEKIENKHLDDGNKDEDNIIEIENN